MADAYISTIKDQRRKLYEQAWEAYQEWRTDRDEVLADGWAYFCRHGFHDNAEGLCGPCEMGADGYFWNWKYEIRKADAIARQNVENFSTRFKIYAEVLKQGGYSETLKIEMEEWISSVLIK